MMKPPTARMIRRRGCARMLKEIRTRKRRCPVKTCSVVDEAGSLFIHLRFHHYWSTDELLDWMAAILLRQKARS